MSRLRRALRRIIGGNGAAPGSTPVRRIASLVLLPFAILYFLIDAIFVSLLRPVARRLADLPIFAGLGRWVRNLGPYPSLALFLVPIIILEPVKPVAAYLFATGHPIDGALVLGLGELVKITVVERLFHMNRDKLLSIGWFARLYGFVMRWLDWLKALPPWQAAVRIVERVRAAARRGWRILLGSART
jgi:hypothetical protein